MSGIFLSHSSQDDTVAAEVKAWLSEQGHRSIFLDFDPAAGIPAGRSWEQELYQQLRVCRAVVIICSSNSMNSRWCFAEITHARAMGKPIFPLLIDDCEVDSVLTDRQIIDLRIDRATGYERLARGLSLAGIDATDAFDWDNTRPPYPGLTTYSEADAAIYFGRDEEIGEGLDLLNQFQRFGGSGLMLILGSSGSGKSSLMRAGLLPRIRRDTEHWLVIDPWRPGENPLDRLALGIAERYGDAGITRSWRDIREELQATADEGGRALWEHTFNDLRQAANASEATVLVFIDQFEELLAHPPDHETSQFLQQLCTALHGQGRTLLVVATLRSDFLSAFQNHPTLGPLPYRTLSLAPISTAGLTDIIRKPAQLAGMDIEQSLTQALLADTQAEDALPLLAFTLRELYELAIADRCGMGVRDYRNQLGGLHGSVARAAQSVVGEAALSEEDEAELRGAFLGMVRINEDGHFVRRTLGWQQLSDGAHEWLNRFVQARLVVAAGSEEQRTVEVAHEALFRAWDLLAKWLDENREALAVQREMRIALRLWEQGGRQTEDLWRGGRLERALELRSTTFDRRLVPREGASRRGRLPIASDALAFLAASEAEDRRIRTRQRTLRIAVIAVSMVVALVTSGLFVQAQYQRNLARTQTLAVQARVAQAERLDLALLLSLEVAEHGDRFESRRLLWQGLESSPQLDTLLRQHSDGVRAVAWSPDGLLLASAAATDPHLLTWDVATPNPTGRTLPGAEAGIWSIEFSPDGRWLAAGANDGAVLLWDAQGPPGKPRRWLNTSKPAKAVYAIRFNHDGSVIAAARSDRTVELWNVETGEPQGAALKGAEDQLRALAWSPDGTIIAAGGMDRIVRLWRATDGAPVKPLLRGHHEGVLGLDWSDDGRYLASGSLDGSVGLWDLDPHKLPENRHHQRIYPQVGPITSLAWNKGARLAITGHRGSVALWDVGDERRRRPLTDPADGQAASTLSIAWSPDGERLATASGKVVALWRAEPRPRLMTRVDLTVNELRQLGPSPDRRQLAGYARHRDTSKPALRLWNANDASLIREIEISGRRAPVMDWSADGKHLLGATTGRTLRRIDVGSSRILDEWRFEREGGGRLDRLRWGVNGTRLAASSRRGVVELWNTAERSLLGEPQDISDKRITSLAWSNDGARLAAGDAGGAMTLWDGLTGVLSDARPSGHAGAVTALAWSPDGAMLASGSEDRTVRLWRGDTGVPENEAWQSHSHAVTQLAWSTDGRTLAAATRDRQIMLWDVARRQVFAGPLSGHRKQIVTLYFSADGKTLTSVDHDGDMRHWDVDPESWHDRTCDLARRNLTSSERRQFLPWAKVAERCVQDSTTQRWRFK